MNRFMKKLGLVMLVLCIICFSFGCGKGSEEEESSKDDKTNSKQEENIADNEDEEEEEAIPERVGAMYAAVQPVIDGEIDDCWASASKLYTDGEYVKGSKQSHGYVSVMWDENNLYFLGVVDDVDITERDLINFWISETYCSAAVSEASSVNSSNIPYSNNPSDGMYYVLVNPYATQVSHMYQNGINFDTDVSGFECKSTQFDGETKGYIVEVKIPRQSDTLYTEGHFMGFDVSIDTYFSNHTERQSYCYWNGAGKYWTYATALGRLPFLK